MCIITENCEEMTVTKEQAAAFVAAGLIYPCPDPECGENIYHMDNELICYGEEMEDGWRAIERELRKMDSCCLASEARDNVIGHG